TRLGLLSCPAVSFRYFIAVQYLFFGSPVVFLGFCFPCFVYVGTVLRGELSLEQEGYHFLVYILYHALEEFKSFEFVNKQRVFLFVYGKLYRLFQLVHFAK